MEHPSPATVRTQAGVTLPVAELYTIAAEYEQAGRLDDAERLAGHILSAYPEQADTLHLGGIVAFRRKHYHLALDRMERAIQHGVDTPLYLRNICEVYRTLGRLDDALATAQRAVALAPGDPLCLHNLAVIQYHRLELDGCIASARAALDLAPGLPGAHFALAEVLLLRGEMAQGWEEYEWRFRIGGAAQPMPPTDKPQWDGLPLAAGRLLLVADQGLGDAIQFMRYIAWAAERCAQLAIAASPEVEPLLHQVAPDAAIFRRWDDCPGYAAHITLSGLPRLHGTRLHTVPWDGPYLRSKADRRRIWADRLAALLPTSHARIGIIWAGRPTHTNDRNRSMALRTLERLGTIPGIALVGLQKGGAASQVGSWFGRAPMISLGPEIADFDDTMAILDTIDLLVTVDTSVGHLAGAMGCPVWLMLPRAPDWRWLLDRDDTPWYPSHRLFRQDAEGSWAAVVDRVAAALPARLAGVSPGSSR